MSHILDTVYGCVTYKLLSRSVFAAPPLCVILESYSTVRAKAVTAPMLCPPSREFTELARTASINHEWGWVGGW